MTYIFDLAPQVSRQSLSQALPSALSLTQKLVAVGLSLGLMLGTASCGSGKSKIPGVQNFNVGVINDHLNASFVANTLNIDIGGGFPIPGLKGASVSVTPFLPTDGSPLQGTLFAFDVDLNQLATTSSGAQGLPDGRALPDVTGGKLPRWDFQVGGPSGEIIYIYLADEAFAIFVPLKLESNGVTLGSTISATFTDEHGNLVGKMYAIPSASNGNSSGLLVLLPFPGHAGSNFKPGIL